MPFEAHKMSEVGPAAASFFSPPMQKNSTFNAPTILTLIRLVASPLLLPVLLVYLLPFNYWWLNGLLALLFTFFGLTDFLDGYLARKLKQETKLGRVLDPIADKFLVYSTLVALLATGKIYFYWVIILIGREFFMMGLRHVALENGITVHVSSWGKLKTLVQMAMLTVMIANPYQALGFCGAFGWNGLEALLLAISLLLSVDSARRYYVTFMKAYNAKMNTESLATDFDSK
jgi:CDP-diacylglycerol--glycerol-3-phosphate 3-phosphatidyltransferase